MKAASRSTSAADTSSVKMIELAYEGTVTWKCGCALAVAVKYNPTRHPLPQDVFERWSSSRCPIHDREYSAVTTSSVDPEKQPIHVSVGETTPSVKTSSVPGYRTVTLHDPSGRKMKLRIPNDVAATLGEMLRRSNRES